MFDTQTLTQSRPAVKRRMAYRGEKYSVDPRFYEFLLLADTIRPLYSGVHMSGIEGAITFRITDRSFEAALRGDEDEIEDPLDAACDHILFITPDVICWTDCAAVLAWDVEQDARDEQKFVCTVAQWEAGI